MSEIRTDHPPWCAGPPACSVGLADPFYPVHRSAPIVVPDRDGRPYHLWLAQDSDGADTRVEVVELAEPVGMPVWRQESLSELVLDLNQAATFGRALRALVRAATA